MRRVAGMGGPGRARAAGCAGRLEVPPPWGPLSWGAEAESHKLRVKGRDMDPRSPGSGSEIQVWAGLAPPQAPGRAATSCPCRCGGSRQPPALRLHPTWPSLPCLLWVRAVLSPEWPHRKPLTKSICETLLANKVRSRVQVDVTLGDTVHVLHGGSGFPVFTK